MLTIMQMTIMVFILLFISINLLENQKIIGLSDCRTTPKVATNKMTKKYSLTRNEPYTISSRSVTHKHRPDSVFVAQSFTFDMPNPEGIG